MAPLDVRSVLAAKAAESKRPSAVVDKEDDLEYDLGHLCAFDPAPVDEAAMAQDRSAYLLRCARDNAQLLTNRLYGLLDGAASKQTLKLPPPTTKLPREKPLPAPKPQTRWEKFAQEKGIVKKKRSKMVWDETTQQWAPRYGYGRANNAKDAPENWVVEAKPGDDGSVDPFEAKANERKERLNKQKRQEERNRLEAAHAASVDARPGAGPSNSRGEKKAYLKQAIAAAQVSTASVGRFDRTLPNEPSKSAGKRKQYESSTDSAAAQKDVSRTASVLDKMFPDSGAKHKVIVDRTVAAKQARLQQESSNRSARASSEGAAGGGGGKKKGSAPKGGKGKGKKK